MSNIQGIIKSIRDIMWQDTGLNGDAQRVEQLGWMLFLKIFSDKDRELELLDDTYTSPIPDKYHWELKKGNWAGDDEGMTGDELVEFVDRKLFPDLRNLDVSTGNKRALIVREVFDGNNNYMKSGINIRKVLNKLNEIDFNIAKDRHAFGEIYEGILKELQSAGKSGEFYTPRAITQFITDMVNPILGEKVMDPACGTGGFLTCAIEHLKKQANNVEQRQALQGDISGWEYKPLPYLLATTNLILHDIEVPNITFRDALDQPLTFYKEKDRVDVILANPPFGGIVANNNEKNFPLNFRTKESADLFLILMIHLLKQGGRAGIVLPDSSLTGDGIKRRVRQKLLEECNLHTIIRLPNSVFQPYANVPTNLLFFDKGKPTEEIWYYEHRLPVGQKSYSKKKLIRLEELNPIKDWWNNRQVSDLCWKVDITTIRDKGFDLDFKNPNSQELDIVEFDKLKDEFELTKRVLSNLLNSLYRKLERKNNYVDYLLANSNNLVQNSTAVEHIRNFIFSLAMQCKLVPQDPKDEPASELLKRIKAEKDKLIKEKKIPKGKELPTLKQEEIPYPLPKNWTWCRLGDTCHNLGQKRPDKEFLYIDVTSVNKLKVINWEAVKMINPENAPSRARKIVDKECVIYSTVRPYLQNIALIDYAGKTEIIVSTAFAVLSPYDGISNLYLYYYLHSPIWTSLTADKMRGMAYPAINDEDLQKLLIPLPPLPEQQRIVEKLNSLMQTCDEMKASIEHSKDLNDQLLQSTLREALHN